MVNPEGCGIKFYCCAISFNYTFRTFNSHYIYLNILIYILNFLGFVIHFFFGLFKNICEKLWPVEVEGVCVIYFEV